MENLQGTLLKGYTLEECIGNGGFGAVYRAKQSTIGREVAIKIILPGYANNPEFIRRFESEANLIARLEHPHITPLYDFWRDPNGAYLVMRHLRGGSLRDALKISTYELSAVAHLMDQIASALDFAHRNNVIHRDIKPANILLDEDGNSYLADFGIAKDLAGIIDNKTAADVVIGSLDYISPEQARSEPVTPRTDVYSLGVTLYELITGDHPFKDFKSIERLYKHINDKLPEIENLPENVCGKVNAVIQKATAKNPADRYADVLEFATALREGIGLGISSDESIVEQLTLREHEILGMITDGMTNREIANELVVTIATVKWHINQLYKKLEVRNRVQAILRARELNLIVNEDTADEFASPSNQPVSVSLPEPENPYKGLHAFQMTDSRDFFGRNDMVDTLIDQMEDGDPFYRFLAVVGPSGSGKSSLVKAGLIPALWKGQITGSEKWFVIDMIPGSHPLDKLEVALMRVAAQLASNLGEHLQRDERGLLRVADLILPNDNTELVIVVDQFEEVFTLVEDEETRQHFLDLLRVAVCDVRSRIRVVVTLRADYYDRPLHYPEFGELVRSRMETILPLSAKGLERAVRGPAERVGVLFEQGLVEQIVSSMNYQAGALPLLQYALTELFDHRKGRLITNEAYHEIGGAVGALANRADEIFNSLNEEGQELAHQMFMRLVTLGEGAEDTRRRATHVELLSITDNNELMEEVIDQFAVYRLLSLDHDPETRQPTIEVAHEAILREWEMLRRWLNESRDDIRQERVLARAAEEWDQHERDNSYLLRGIRLEQVEKWRDTSKLVQTQLEQDYIVHSLLHREKEKHAEFERKERESRLEQRSQNFLRGLVAVLTLATLIATFLTVIAMNASTEAAVERDNAQENFLRAERIRLAAQAQITLDKGSDVRIPALLALRSLELGYSPEADGALLTALSRDFSRQIYVGHTGSGITTVGFSPDASQIVTSSTDATARLWDTFTGEELQRFVGHAGSVSDAAFMPDGKSIVTSGNDGTIRQWSVASGDEIRRLQERDVPIRFMELSPDGKLLATTDEANGGQVWRIDEMVLLFELSSHTDLVNQMRFSPDNKKLASTSHDGSIRLWDTETGEEVQRFEGHATGVWDVAFSPSGDRIVSVSADQTARIWDIETGEEIHRLIGHPGTLFSVAFSPDGNTIATTSATSDRVIRLWDAETGAEITQLEGHTAPPTEIVFSPDGHYLLSGSLDNISRLWEVRDETEPRVYTQPTDTIHANTSQIAILSTDASQIISVVSNGMIRIWDVKSQGKVSAFRTESDSFVTDAAIATKHNLILTGNEGGIAKLWNLDTGELVLQYEGHIGSITSVVFAPSEEFFVTGGNDNVAILWTADSDKPLMKFEGHTAPITNIAFSQDSSFVATASEDGSAILWDAGTGAEIRRFVGKEGIVLSVAFSPNGQYLLTGCDNDTATLWNVETGEVAQQYVGHTGAVQAVTFSRDGRMVVTGSVDQTARLWDTESGVIIRQLVGHVSGLRTVDLSADDGLLVTGDNESTYLWRTNLDDIIAITCGKISNDLTEEERTFYEINNTNEVCQVD